MATYSGGQPAQEADEARLAEFEKLADPNNKEHASLLEARERAAFADNSIRYEAALRFINGDSRTILSAIQGQ